MRLDPSGLRLQDDNVKITAPQDDEEWYAFRMTRGRCPLGGGHDKASRWRIKSAMTLQATAGMTKQKQLLTNDH